jgi:EAL domain-containing protein (putative c-di-GMP-specific phosphodiesterase class I)
MDDRDSGKRSVVDLSQDSAESFRADLARLEQIFEQAVGTMALHFQPIVLSEDHRLFGYEALLRTNNPNLPSPGDMFDAAERLNRVEKLGRVIRAEVYRRALEAPKDSYLFVNMHALDFLDKGLTSQYSPLSKMRERVVLEVTERESLDGMTDVRFRLAELRELGYRIAIDDLGAGHSRMNKMLLTDTDFVKLDMSMIRGIDKHPFKQKLVESVTALCRAHDIKVIGEGVETAEERQVLCDLGCDLLQGFFIARPTLQFIEPPVISRR